MPPAKLKGLKFAEFFQWLSASIQIVAASVDKETESVDLPLHLIGWKVLK